MDAEDTQQRVRVTAEGSRRVAIGSVMVRNRPLLLLLVSVLVSGACSGDPGADFQPAEGGDTGTSPDASERQTVEAAPQGPEDGIFRGTAAERSEAMMACYERRGIAVDPLPGDPTGFRVKDPMSREERQGLRQACIDEIGEWTQESFPDGYVRQHYDHRIWQRECLMGLGYSLAEPPSFEAFEEGMEWDPFGEVVAAVGLRPPEFHEVRDECPYLHQYEGEVERGQR